jgi:hypothetical protein
MATAYQLYQAEQYAKHHYRQLLTAKSSVRQLTARPSPASLPRTPTPQDKYEFRLTNHKLCNRLTQIYEKPPSPSPRPARPRSSALRPHASLEQDNMLIFERILTAKSTLGDWKQREKQLKQYSKLTRKKQPHNADHFFQAFREILVDSRSKRSRKGTKSNSSRGSRPASSSLRSHREPTLTPKEPPACSPPEATI